MSFLDLIQTTKAISLSDRLNPTELSVYEEMCREYSKTFYTPLLEVMSLDPEFVMRMVFSEQMSQWQIDEETDKIIDLIGTLSDPEYDAKKEKALREETKRLVEEEELRIQENRPIHESLLKNTSEKSKEDLKSKTLPASGGLNMDVIRRLQNDDKEN